MADVIKVDNTTFTIFDVNDILEIIMNRCGSDIYAWIQNYIDELDFELKEHIKENEETTEWYENRIIELETEIGRLYREIENIECVNYRLP